MLALVIGWITYQLRWTQLRDNARRDPELYCTQVVDQDIYDASVREGLHPVPVPAAPWPLRILGENGVAEIWVSRERDGNAVRRLFPEAVVNADDYLPATQADRP